MHEESSVHVVPVPVFVKVWGALVVLTLVTTGVAFLNLGPFNNVVALGIAVAKATLVVLFFMNLRAAARMNRVVLLSSLLWLVILVTITLSDYFTRGWLGVPGR